jgi:repressor LexA
MALTKRQKEVLDYLVAFQNKNGYSPSYLEIAGAMKLSSLATVHKHLSTLERKGFVRRGYNQSRSIEITQLPKPIREQVIERHSTSLPLMGRIAAGRPLEAQVANNGEIVVALVDGDEATVKRFHREPGGKIRLQPANSQMAPMIFAGEDVKVQGKVVGVLRKY